MGLACPLHPPLGMTRKLVPLGPLAVDRITTSRALARIDGLIRHGRGGFVVTPNVDHIVLANQLPRLREAYKKASLSLADGQPLLWMSRALGRPIPEKISGSDFIYTLAAHAVARDYGVFLYGASEAVSAKAAEVLTERFPGLRIVGRDTTAWPNAHPERVVQKIKDSGAQIVIVALGCPKQEAWMLQHSSDIRPAMAFGLGGSLDFVAGKVKRAPRWMSRSGLEWSYRLAREPRRMAHRYLVRDRKIVPLFLGMLATRLRGPRRRVAAVSV
jgi:N-acetylglucosaminyldiphosphoundecaprenol N-acetyl-beta-D-mannosaminyltransferase